MGAVWGPVSGPGATEAGCDAPHRGQNLLPLGTSVPQAAQNAMHEVYCCPMRRRQFIGALIFAAVSLVLLVLSACSGPPPPSSSPAPNAPAPDSKATSSASIPPRDFRPNRSFRYSFPTPDCHGAQYGSGHHDYPATDIIVPQGTPFLAVTSGVVDWVNREDRWDPRTDRPSDRGGISIAIVGRDGVRYYGSHLSDIEPGLSPGTTVGRGQLLGHTGQTGNARLSVPHLHFGISSPTSPQDWEVRRGEVWPYRYLRAWCSGRSLTPRVPG